MAPTTKVFVQTAAAGFGAIAFAILCSLLFGKGSTDYSDQTYRRAVALLPIVIGLLGVLVAILEDWAKNNKVVVILTFTAVSGFTAYLTVRQGDQLAEQAARAQEKAEIATKDLADSVGEIGKVQTLNQKLQEQLLDQSNQLIDSSARIVDLSKEAISTSTGGDSFCYMDLSPLSADGMIPVFVPQGRYPLYELQARIVDLQKFDQIVKRRGNTFEASTNLALGNIIGLGLIPNNPPVFPMGDAQRRDFRVFFNARNGQWMEDLQLVKIGNDWRQAKRITWRGGKKEKVIFNKIDKQIPKNGFAWHD